MKEFVSKTSDEVGFNCYWADEVAISLLETVLNVKFIIVRDNDSIKGAKPTSKLHNMDPVDALEELNKLLKIGSEGINKILEKQNEIISEIDRY